MLVKDTAAIADATIERFSNFFIFMFSFFLLMLKVNIRS